VQGGYYAGRSPQRVEDGSCLQIGIGGMPNAVCCLLMESSVKDLGIHTEMMTDNLCLLYRSGRITGSQKHSLCDLGHRHRQLHSQTWDR